MIFSNSLMPIFQILYKKTKVSSAVPGGSFYRLLNPNEKLEKLILTPLLCKTGEFAAC